jgi:hypothetical protein
VHHVGTKLNDRERRELETLLGKRGLTQGKFIRDLILATLATDADTLRASVELEEITAVRLLLINLLRLVATGQPMAEKTFDAYVTETKKRKTEIALNIAKEHEARF